MLLGFKPRSCLNFCDSYFWGQLFTLSNIMLLFSHLDHFEAWPIHPKICFWTFFKCSLSLLRHTNLEEILFPGRYPSVSPRSHPIYHLPLLQSITFVNIYNKNTHFFFVVLLPSWDYCTSLFCTLSLIRSPFLHFNEISNK